MLAAIAAVLAAAVTALPAGLPSGTDVDYQLGGASAPAANVGIVVRDRTEAPAGGPGGATYDICYVNGFQTQPGERQPWKKRPGLVLRDADGRPVVDEAWGEKLLDIRTPAKRRALAGVVDGWVAGCAAAGYDAVEYDNLDSFTRSDGLITRKQALAYAKKLTKVAHAHGLAAGQKNLADLDGTSVGYDFAVSEECGRYDECGDHVASFGDQVVMIEYRSKDFAKTCAAYGATHAVVLRDRDLTPSGVHEWC